MRAEQISICAIGGVSDDDDDMAITHFSWSAALQCVPVLGFFFGAALAAAPAPVASGAKATAFAGGGVDAPELAAPGPFPVGLRVLHLTHRDQVDPLASPAAKRLIVADRKIEVLLWYPAARGGRPESYPVALPSAPPTPPRTFRIEGAAVRDVPPAGRAHPAVILAHGYSNDPAMLAWLGENLASKGYVVLAPRHDDPPITDLSQAGRPMLNRPLDIAFLARAVRNGLLGDMVDPTRVALAGYSLGGYGALAAAGARLDPAGPMTALWPAGLLARYGPGGAEAGAMDAGPLRAVVVLAPAGGPPLSAWTKDGSAGLTAPLLVVAGDADRTVGYQKGPLAIWENAVHADRTLLLFRGAGHSLGVGPVPDAMRARLWDLDWFEDPVWRKDRLNAISLHFITAFLDLHLKGDASRADYFRVASEQSDAAVWQAPDAPYDARSMGGANPAWKGFQRNHQNGLVLRHRDAAP